MECGAPDFVVSRKAAHGPVTVGYIEAKDVGKPLDEIEHSEQMRQYLAALPNLILTDYLEFRWYVDGERRLSARLAHVGKGRKLIAEAPASGGSAAVPAASQRDAGATSQYFEGVPPGFGISTLEAIRFAKSGSKTAGAGH